MNVTTYATCGACNVRFDDNKGHTCPKWNPSQADVTRWERILHTIACDNTGGELCDRADYTPPEPNR